MKREQWRQDVDIQITFPDDKDRQETVIEITNSDHSRTFGYLLPEYAAVAVTAVNSHEKLIEVALAVAKRYANDFALPSEDAELFESALDALTSAEAGTVAAGAEYDPDCPTCLEQEQRQFQEQLRQTMLSNPLVKEVDLP